MLHTVNKSPFERNALDSCLGHAEAGSAIILIEDAVYAALAGTAASAKVEAKVAANKIFVLEADLKARGVADKALIAGVTVVDYAGFVDLVVEHGTVNAWL